MIIGGENDAYHGCIILTAGPGHLRLEPGDVGGVLEVLGHDDLRRENEAGSARKDYHERGEMSSRMTHRNVPHDHLFLLFER